MVYRCFCAFNECIVSCLRGMINKVTLLYVYKLEKRIKKLFK